MAPESGPCNCHVQTILRKEKSESGPESWQGNLLWRVQCQNGCDQSSLPCWSKPGLHGLESPGFSIPSHHPKAGWPRTTAVTSSTVVSYERKRCWWICLFPNLFTNSTLWKSECLWWWMGLCFYGICYYPKLHRYILYKMEIFMQ